MTSKFLDALQLKNKGRPPVWIMRQAGRYLPSYRALREKYSFLELCHNPELIVEVTELPLKKFALDAAILFSDILVIPEAYGLGLHFEETKGPQIHRPLVSSADVNALPTLNIEESLGFVGEGIARLKKQLTVPLIGFSGAPFTLASYMIEGGSSKDFKKTKQWMLSEPESFHALLKHITKSVIDYLKMQIEKGVDAIQIFDSWAHVLSFAHFREFSLHYLREIATALLGHVPVIAYCRGSSVFAEELATIPIQGISVDWNGDLKKIRKEVGTNICLQGNLDPDILRAPPSVIRREVSRLLTIMQDDPAYIFNLGHGITPDIPPEHVQVMVETIYESSN